MIIRNDEVGLLALEQGIDPSHNAKGGAYQNQTVIHGFNTQVKSKDALYRIKGRVAQINELADEGLSNIEKQN